MLAGLVVALALIPEAISVTIAVVGGRPAMISAATGAIALVVAPIAREHGIDCQTMINVKVSGTGCSPAHLDRQKSRATLRTGTVV